MQKKTIEKMPKNTHSPISSKLSQAQEDKRAEIKSKNSQQELIAKGDQTPRFVTCVSHDVYNGNLKEYTWDKEKIFVHESLEDDVLMLQNVFEGKIISSLIYPLVFDYKSSQRETSLRSIEFYREVQSDPSIYYNLSPDEKGYFLIGARDLFIAAGRGMLSQEEKDILVNIVNLIDPKDSNIVYQTINNIDIAPYPTATHKMVRFIEEEKKSEEDKGLLDECFVRNELGLLIGFVDPRDLSFHNFENIINLDSLFKADECFSIRNFEKLGDSEVYTFDLEDKNNTLLSLDRCGFYTQPINKLSRGGERFIFASKVLADNFTKAFREHVAHKHKTLINPEFQFVNCVFRYNKFKPGDRKFTSHLDTPYDVPARKHYSKYTLLLYLTPGTADPVLSIDDGKVKINNIATNNGCVKGVIFDQKYEHEGKSFIDFDKIFLRSELVYSYPKKGFSVNADISRKFNIACYMTKQSVFNPELERYASDCFDQVAQARINLANAKFTEDVLLYKDYKGVPFITNGYDYWFLKNTNLKRAAIVTIIDYFGAKYTGLNEKDYGTGAVCSIEDVKDVFIHLKKYACREAIDEVNMNIQKQENARIEEEENDNDLIESLKSESADFPYSRSINMTKIRGYDSDYEYKSSSEGKDEDDSENESQSERVKWSEDVERNSMVCIACYYEHPTADEIVDFLEDKKEDSESLAEKKNEFAIFIFNEEIKIEKSKIRINEDCIVFEEKIPPVHFAGQGKICRYNIEKDNAELFDKKTLSLKGYTNIPPIPYVVHPEGYHLKIELFNNGFVREEDFKIERVSLKDEYIKKDSSEKSNQEKEKDSEDNEKDSEDNEKDSEDNEKDSEDNEKDSEDNEKDSEDNEKDSEESDT